MSGNLLPPVVGELKATITDFKKKMADARGDMDKTAKEGKSKLGGLATGMAIGLGGAAVAVGGFAKASLGKFEEVAGAVSKMQRLTGGSAEEMSRLRFAAQETGVSTDTLTKGLVKLSKGIDSGNKAFAENGIQVKDAQGKLLSMNDIMANTAEKFASMPNGIEKNALAMKLFGKSGTDLIPLLNKGKEGLAKFGEESDKFGLTLGQDNVDAFKKNVAAHRTMHAAWEGLQVQIGAKIMPIVAKITSWLAEKLPAAMNFVKKAIDVLDPAFGFLSAAVDIAFKAVAAGVSWLMDHKEFLIAIAAVIATGLVIAFVSWATAAAAAAIATITAMSPLIAIAAAVALVAAGLIYAYNHFEIFRTIVNTVRDALITAWNFISDYLIPIFVKIVEIAILPVVLQFKAIKAVITDVLIPAFQAVWNFISDHVIPIFESIGSAIATAGKAVGTAVGDIVGFVTGIPGKIGQVVSTLWDGIKTGVTDAKDWVHDRIEDVISFARNLPNRMVGIFSGMWDGIKDAFKAAINWIIRGWNGLEFKMPSLDLGPLGSIGGWTVGPPNIPLLASGGRVTESGLAVVGDAGAELLNLPRGATVTPLNGSRGDAGGNVVHIGEVHIHMPFGSDGDDVVRAIKTFEGRNGPGWRAA